MITHGLGTSVYRSRTFSVPNCGLLFFFLFFHRLSDVVSGPTYSSKRVIPNFKSTSDLHLSQGSNLNRCELMCERRP